MRFSTLLLYLTQKAQDSTVKATMRRMGYFSLENDVPVCVDTLPVLLALICLLDP